MFTKKSLNAKYIIPGDPTQEIHTREGYHGPVCGIQDAEQLEAMIKRGSPLVALKKGKDKEEVTDPPTI